MTRQAKTPAQRAEEALAVLERKVARLEQKRDAAEAVLNSLTAELDAERDRLGYARKHPDLPDMPTVD